MKTVCVAFAVLALSGCALLAPAKPGAEKEVLSELPSGLPQRAPHAATVLVFPPETRPMYDTTQMAYTQIPFQMGYFVQYEWSETPSQMLHALLIKTLKETHYFSEVLTPPYPGRYTYSLHTEIAELLQDFTSQPPTLRLSLHLVLSDSAGNRVISTRDIALREPMQQGTPYAGVVAANHASAKALLEAVSFVLEKMP